MVLSELCDVVRLIAISLHMVHGCIFTTHIVLARCSQMGPNHHCRSFVRSLPSVCSPNLTPDTSQSTIRRDSLRHHLHPLGPTPPQPLHTHPRHNRSIPNHNRHNPPRLRRSLNSLLVPRLPSIHHRIKRERSPLRPRKHLSIQDCTSFTIWCRRSDFELCSSVGVGSGNGCYDCYPDECG